MLKTITGSGLRSALAGAASAMALAVSAQAVEVKESMDYNVPAEKVWAVIGEYCSIAAWHPAVAKCDLSEDKKTRTLTLHGGGELVEPMVSMDAANMTYTYNIAKSPLPVDAYESTLKVTGSGEKSTLEWSSKFEAKGVRDDEAQKVITGIYRAGLENIAKKF